MTKQTSTKDNTSSNLYENKNLKFDFEILYLQKLLK